MNPTSYQQQGGYRQLVSQQRQRTALPSETPLSRGQLHLICRILIGGIQQIIENAWSTVIIESSWSMMPLEQKLKTNAKKLRTRIVAQLNAVITGKQETIAGVSEQDIQRLLSLVNGDEELIKTLHLERLGPVMDPEQYANKASQLCTSSIQLFMDQTWSLVRDIQRIRKEDISDDLILENFTKLAINSIEEVLPLNGEQLHFLCNTLAENIQQIVDSLWRTTSLTPDPKKNAEKLRELMVTRLSNIIGQDPKQLSEEELTEPPVAQSNSEQYIEYFLNFLRSFDHLVWLVNGKESFIALLHLERFGANITPTQYAKKVSQLSVDTIKLLIEKSDSPVRDVEMQEWSNDQVLKKFEEFIESTVKGVETSVYAGASPPERER
jgi:hypothetical protein